MFDDFIVYFGPDDEDDPGSHRRVYAYFPSTGQTTEPGVPQGSVPPQLLANPHPLHFSHPPHGFFPPAPPPPTFSPLFFPSSSPPPAYTIPAPPPVFFPPAQTVFFPPPPQMEFAPFPPPPMAPAGENFFQASVSVDDEEQLAKMTAQQTLGGLGSGVGDAGLGMKLDDGEDEKGNSGKKFKETKKGGERSKTAKKVGKKSKMTKVGK